MTPSVGDAAIDAVVVTYRSGSTLDECLARLRASRDVAGIIVVDNASDDASAEIAARHAAGDARFTALRNPDNAGFGPACNLGARHGTSPFIAFVNPDCWVEPDSLARLRDHLTRAGGGLVGADLVDGDGVRDPAARRQEPTLGRLLKGRGTRASVAVPIDAGVALQPVDAVSGALMMLRRPTFVSLGGFDEDYRLHAEDLDLCRRVRAAGEAVRVANDVRVVHLRGVSSRTRPVFVEWHKHRGMWRYFSKFEGPGVSLPRRLLAFAAIWAHFVMAAPRAWLQSRGASGDVRDEGPTGQR